MIYSLRKIMNLFPTTFLYSTISRLVLTFIIVAALFAGHLQSASAQTCDPYVSPHLRFGINVDQGGGQSIGDYFFESLNAGWYHNYGYQIKENAPTVIDFVPMFRGDNTSNLESRLGPTIDANLGEVWLAGNEPDRIGQDGILAEDYAEFYHEAYEFIKGRDPTAQIAFGGVVQPTPLRLEYLDRVVATYNQRYGTNPPADIIHTHAFVMNEVSWGAGRPPGENYTSEPRDIEPPEQWDMTLFREQMYAMRQWMKDNGYQQKPLIVSEYGLLLPDVFHPNGEAESINFLISSFDFFLNEKDADLGYGADDNRLVQKFAWFSLNYPQFNYETYEGLNGALFDRETEELTYLGSEFADYTENMIVETIDLHLRNMQISTASPISTTMHPTVTIDVEVLNTGGIVSEESIITLWNGDPQAGGTQIGTAPLLDVLPACEEVYTVSFDWDAFSVPTGSYDLYITADAANVNLEVNASDNVVIKTVQIETNPNEPTPEPTMEPTPLSTATPTEEPTELPEVTSTPEADTPTPTMTTQPVITPDEPGETSTPDLAGTPTPNMTAQLTSTPDSTAMLQPTETPTPPLTGTPMMGTPTALPTSSATQNPAETPITETPNPMTSTPMNSATPTGEPIDEEPTDTPEMTPMSTPTATTPGSVPIVPIASPVPTNSRPPAVPTVPASVIISTKANPEMVTNENRDVIYTVTYQYPIGLPLEDVRLVAEFIDGTEFLAAASDPRWVCSDTGNGGSCVLAIGQLNAMDQDTLDFALRFIFPQDEEIASFETKMVIYIGDSTTSIATDKTTVMVEAQTSTPVDVNTLFIPLIEVGE